MSKQNKHQLKPINGIVLLDKAEGASSNHVMQQVRFLFKAKKAGHTGALDPLATGMLPICFGEATKYSQYLLDSDKEYIVTAKLGERTTSSDSDGEIVETRNVEVEASQLLQRVASFQGKQQQTPSIYSALKYQGKPLYYYARNGIDVPRPTREINVFEIELTDISLPYISMRIACSKGTYIRTIVDDLGEQLGCGAHVTALRRTKVAHFPTDKMMSFDAFSELTSEQRQALILPMDTALDAMPLLEFSLEQGDRLLNGQRFYLEQAPQVGEYRAYKESEFVGIVEVKDNGLIQPRRIVQNADK